MSLRVRALFRFLAIFAILLAACGPAAPASPPAGQATAPAAKPAAQPTTAAQPTAAAAKPTTAAAPAAAKEPFVIGVTAAATGAAAFFGKPEFDAAKLAADEINAAGGINGRQIQLVTEDDEGKPDKGAAIVQRFVSQKVDVILGTVSSGVALASVGYADDAGILYIAALPANPDITAPGGKVRKWVFRVAQSDTANAEFMGDYAAKKYKRVALLSDTTGYGAGGRDAVSKYMAKINVKPVADETYDSQTPDLTPQLNRIKQANADVIINWGISVDAATLMRNLKNLKMDVPVVGLPGLGGTAVCDLAGDAAVGLTHLDTWDPGKPEAQALSEKWQKKLGQPLDNYFGAAAYDGMMVIAQALKVGDKDREKVRAAVESIKNYPGALGKKGSVLNLSPTNHDSLAKDGIVVKQVTDKSCSRKIID